MQAENCADTGRSHIHGPVELAEVLGTKLGEELLAKGAAQILEKVKNAV